MPACQNRWTSVALGAVLLLGGCQGSAPPEANNAAAPANTASDLPVQPGIYGNVQPGGGVELQIYGPPRDMLEVTFCKGPCTVIRRARYEVGDGVLSFSYLESAANGEGETRTLRLSQQGADVRAEDVAAGGAPMILRRLPRRIGLAAAQAATMKGSAR